MRWSERLWRLRECWRKLGALAGKGAGERLDYTCDLIMEAWVDQGGVADLDDEARGIARAIRRQAEEDAVLEELRRWWR